MKYEMEAFEDLVRHGYLRKSENEHLVLYGYTEQTTFERAWQTKYTRDARGIIFEKKTGRLVAKPFPKFFNLGEMEEVNLLNLPKEPYEVFEKVDGSLGIIYYYGGKWNIATRGSLSSEQAIKGAEILQKYDLEVLKPGYTFLVEIIYPSNKIIVDYGMDEKLVMLGAFNINTGEEVEPYKVQFIAANAHMPIAKSFSYTIEEMIKLQKTMPKDEEGFVVRFQGGTRVKIKGEEYLKIAKILSQLSPLSMWEAMKDGTVNKEYLAQVPEELRPEFEPIVTALETRYQDTMNEIRNDFESLQIEGLESPAGRKTLGLLIQGEHKLKHPGAMFPYLQRNPSAIQHYVMKLIRPTANVL